MKYHDLVLWVMTQCSDVVGHTEPQARRLRHEFHRHQNIKSLT